MPYYRINWDDYVHLFRKKWNINYAHHKYFDYDNLIEHNLCMPTKDGAEITHYYSISKSSSIIAFEENFQDKDHLHDKAQSLIAACFNATYEFHESFRHHFKLDNIVVDSKRALNIHCSGGRVPAVN